MILLSLYSAFFCLIQICSNLGVQRDYQSKKEIRADTIASSLYITAQMKRNRFICYQLRKLSNNQCYSGVLLLFVHLHYRLNYF